MKRYNAYILKINWSLTARSEDIELSWPDIAAHSRREAMISILPAIREYLTLHPPIKRGRFDPRVSVYVGERHNPTAYAGRLSPYVVDCEGNLLN